MLCSNIHLRHVRLDQSTADDNRLSLISINIASNNTSEYSIDNDTIVKISLCNDYLDTEDEQVIVIETTTFHNKNMQNCAGLFWLLHKYVFLHCRNVFLCPVVSIQLH